MKIFILDDDENVIRILKKIVYDRKLGLVIGHTTDGDKGLKEIKRLKPDLVLIDLLMPETDGLTIIKTIKKEYPQIEFIMISQVSSKDMVAKAYKYGVEYYIYKPINALEVESIIRKVIERIDIDRTLLKIQSLFNKKQIHENERDVDRFCEDCIKKVLHRLGVAGEKGNQDIIEVTRYIIDNNINITEITIRELCSNFSENPGSMEQRMRRTISLAMNNIASLGIEDYMNDIFVEYSSSLFNFEQVRREMDYIRGKSNKGGSINMKKFLMGIITYCENINF
ncbi:MAG TPA: response regulator [Tissierellales bacterium]|nr:response regulator [Tissierellales bacterium]